MAFKNPFKRRVKRVYNPNAPKLRLDFISIIAIIISSLIGLWVISYLWGNWLNLSPIGPVMMVILFAAVIILSLIIVKQKKDGAEMSQKDFGLIILLVVLLVLGFVFLPELAPELYQQSIQSIQTSGLQAFIPGP